MFSHSWCWSCKGARSWRYREEGRRVFFSFIYWYTVEWIPKKETTAELFQLCALTASSDIWWLQRNMHYKATSKTCAKSANKKRLMHLWVLCRHIQQHKVLKMFCHRMSNLHCTGEGDEHPLHTVNGEKERRMPLGGEGRAVFKCALTTEQETHQP